MNSSFQLGPHAVGTSKPLLIIAGPCSLEAPELNLHIATTLKDLCHSLGLGYVFKASFDKANRTSDRSPRGLGFDDGLEELARIKEKAGVPICTDIHLPEQAQSVAQVADLLQIPAFLCRQTDLLVAAAETDAAVNVKKGQFLSPAEMKHVRDKLDRAGASKIMLTERGTFFGYHRLVNDFIGLGDLIDLNVPVCFDVTHSTQLPGGGNDQTAGRPDRAALLLRSAVAAGVHALFIECHPSPAEAISDADTMQPLAAMPELLASAVAIRSALESGHPQQ